MYNAIRGRVGHSADTYIILGKKPAADGQDGEEKAKRPAKSQDESDSESFEPNVLYYEEKTKLKVKLAETLNSMPEYSNMTVSHEQTINTEESRQVIHGIWSSEISDKLWNTLNKEQEVDFAFHDLNPATTDHCVVGTCTQAPVIKAAHFKELIDKVVFKAEVTEKGRNVPQSTNRVVPNENAQMVIIFGGASPSEKQLRACKGNLSLLSILDVAEDLKVNNELFTVSVRSADPQWKPIASKGCPSARAFHASTIMYTDFATPILCVTGGFGQNRRIMDMTLHMMPLVQKNEHPVWIALTAAGKMPTPRYGHTMGQVHEYITVFGGTNGYEILNDLWVLNLHQGTVDENNRNISNEWIRVEIAGPTPAPRCFHASVKIGIQTSNPIIIYGGVTADDSARAYALKNDQSGNLRWSILPVMVTAPHEKRAFHSMAYHDGQILVTGGEDFTIKTPSVHQCLMYHINAREFQYTKEALPLTGHRSVLLDGMMYHLGGIRNTSRVSIEPIPAPKINATQRAQNASAGSKTGSEGKKKAVQIAKEAAGGLKREEKANKSATQQKPSTSANAKTKTPSQPNILDFAKKVEVEPEFHTPRENNTDCDMGVSTKPKRDAARKCAQTVEEEIARRRAQKAAEEAARIQAKESADEARSNAQKVAEETARKHVQAVAAEAARRQSQAVAEETAMRHAHMVAAESAMREIQAEAARKQAQPTTDMARINAQEAPVEVAKSPSQAAGVGAEEGGFQAVPNGTANVISQTVADKAAIVISQLVPGDSEIVGSQNADNEGEKVNTQPVVDVAENVDSQPLVNAAENVNIPKAVVEAENVSTPMGAVEADENVSTPTVAVERPIAGVQAVADAGAKAEVHAEEKEVPEGEIQTVQDVAANVSSQTSPVGVATEDAPTVVDSSESASEQTVTDELSQSVATQLQITNA
ncbi:CCAAT-box DNA binding subunit B, putative [Babesia ovata]|uniref:CCAAT-box DNA binding subunit B, putative n=1 Tax=Babesia ovata TaxID=189622 RepID=A0A2H6KG19_9APIC|nr:CCAAT-box DNA binding subunit B, putative [Babesia ovata]GBE61927.1 CCAAT-box DNA binding subunit B, putative [Babesia ovata]